MSGEKVKQNMRKNSAESGQAGRQLAALLPSFVRRKRERYCLKDHANGIRAYTDCKGREWLVSRALQSVAVQAKRASPGHK